MTAIGQDRTILGMSFLLPCTVAVWLALGHTTMTSGTFAMLAALGLGIAAVTVNTLSNGRSTGSIGQLIHETDIDQTTVRRSAETTPGIFRRTSNRARSALVISAAVTMALLYLGKW